MRTLDFYCEHCKEYIELSLALDEDVNRQACPKCSFLVRRAWITAPQMNVAFMPKRGRGYDPRYVDQPEDRDGRKEQLFYLDQWHRTGTGGLSDAEYAHHKKNIEADIEKNPAQPKEGS